MESALAAPGVPATIAPPDPRGASYMISRFVIPCSLLALALSTWSCALDEQKADFTFLNAEPESIDPGRVTGQPGGRIALSLFEGLCFRHPQTLAPVPGMAERWEKSDDGLVYTFHLREASWSDGVAFSSEDFRWSWTRLLDPETGAKYANFLYPVRGARAFHQGENTDPSSLGLSCPDARTFVVELENPVAYFLDLCSFYPLAPVPRRTLEAHGDAWTRPENIVGNGAFVLESWQINRRLRLRKNSKYWDAARVQLEVVDALPGDYINGNFNRYMSGVVDWIDADGVPLGIVDALAERDDFHVAPYLNTYFYRFNVEHPPLDDARVRRALYHAVDPVAICEHVTRGGQQPATSLVPPGIPGYASVELGGFQPELARALLAEAGYPRGRGFPVISLLFNTSDSHKQVAEVLQQQWKDVLGVQIGLENQEWKVFMVSTQRREYDIARGGWIGDYLDPNTFLDLWTSSNANNRTGFSSPAYDALIAEAARVVDGARRMELLRRCESIITQEECIILPIYFYVVTNMYDGGRWGGLEPNLINSIDLKSIYRRGES